MMHERDLKQSVCRAYILCGQCSHTPGEKYSREPALEFEIYWTKRARLVLRVQLGRSNQLGGVPIINAMNICRVRLLLRVSHGASRVYTEQLNKTRFAFRRV